MTQATATPGVRLLNAADHTLIMIDYQSQMAFATKSISATELRNNAGLVASAETPESLADALAEIVKSPEVYSRYRISAWERSKTFSWPTILPQMVAWLEGHAQKKKPAN